MLASLRTATVFGVEACTSTSRSTSRSGFRCSPWWVCPIRAFAKAATGSRARFATRASTSRPSDHGEPRAGRRAKGRLRVRPANRARHPRRPGRRRTPVDQRSRHSRRAVARRRHSAGARCAAGCRRGPARRRCRHPAAAIQCGRSRHCRRASTCWPVSSLAEAVRRTERPAERWACSPSVAVAQC